MRKDTSGRSPIRRTRIFRVFSPAAMPKTAAGTGCMASIDAERWLAEHGQI